MTAQKTKVPRFRADGRQAGSGREGLAARAILAFGLLSVSGCLKPLPDLPDTLFVLGPLEASKRPQLSYPGSPFVFPVGVAMTPVSPGVTGGGPTSCVSAPTLPAGLNLGTDCALSGTPTAVQAATGYTIVASNAHGSGETRVSIEVVVQPRVTITGLMGTLDLVLNGTETVSLSDPGGSAAFTTPIAIGGSYSIVASQRATFTVDAAKRNWRSQVCTVTGGTGTVAAGDPAPAIAIACVNTPTVYDPTNDLTWMRCTQRQTYRPATNDCQGIGSLSDNYGVDWLSYCPTADDACNDTVAASESGLAVSGHLNGAGSSAAYASCNDLNNSGGTYGKTNWRLPTMNPAELLHIQETAAPFHDPGLFPDAVVSIYRSSSARDGSNAWGVNFEVGGAVELTKIENWLVRCIAPGP